MAVTGGAIGSGTVPLFLRPIQQDGTAINISATYPMLEIQSYFKYATMD